MRAKLSEFVDKHIDKLPVLEFHDDEVGQTVIIKWKPLELYKQMLSFRYDYRKGKRSRTSSNSAKSLQEKTMKADNKSEQQTMEDAEEKLDGEANSSVAANRNISNKSQRSCIGDDRDGKGLCFTEEVDHASPTNFVHLRKTMQFRQSKQQQQEPETRSNPLSSTPIKNSSHGNVDRFDSDLDDPEASSPQKAGTSTPMTRASKQKLANDRVQTRTIDSGEGRSQREVILDKVKVTVAELTLESRRVIALMVLGCESVTGIAARIIVA
ncbi:hypothetical protein R1sor_024529 [Riccia sorocarpa]|uniref:Uncharacterized protein n=1 Tax=Riccia sorocarpa TaxID=122646 RepID=A0ABD3GQT8_9MARC